MFALVNGLAKDSMLSPEDALWVRSSNDRANAAYPDPTTVVADCYDPIANPGARSWFRSSASDWLGLTREYLDLLDRYGVRWAELRTSTPGRFTYEDDVQVVAVPYAYPDDWPFEHRLPTPRPAARAAEPPAAGARLMITRGNDEGPAPRSRPFAITGGLLAELFLVRIAVVCRSCMSCNWCSVFL